MAGIDFNKIKTDMISAGKEVGDFAKGAVDTAKIRIDIRTKEDFLTKQYAEIGKAFYEAHSNDEETPEGYDFTSIREARAELDRLQAELEETSDSVTCSNCGCKQAKGSNYCKNCGAAL